jgi:hypothetical protein
MTALLFIDENTAFTQLPRYAVENLDEIPVMRMERGELEILISKLDKIEENISDIRLNIANEEATMFSSSQQLARVSSIVDNLTSAQAGHTADRCLDLASARASAPLARQPLVHRDNRQSMDYDTTADCESEGGMWKKASARKKRRVAEAHLSPTSPNVNNNRPTVTNETETILLWSDRVANSQPVKQPPPKKRFSRIIIGKTPVINDNSDLSVVRVKSAKPYVKKRVFGIYNVDPSVTETSLAASITASCGLNPISCFQVKSRDENSSAFRVCINDDITDKFLTSTKLWASGIVINPWTFKPKGPAAPTAAAAASAIDSMAAVSDNINN